MLKQKYGYTIFEFDEKATSNPVKQLTDRLFFTVRGNTPEELDEAAEKKLQQLKEECTGNTFIDDICWGDPEKVEEEW
jgi:hypothetical protein